MGPEPLLRDVDALVTGEAYAILDRVANVRVSGADAIGWLQDLLTAEIASLPVGGARRSFLLTPTGRIRADLRVVREPAGVTLLEPDDEDPSVAAMLTPYVLGSAVSLSDPAPVRIATFPADVSDAIHETLQAVAIIARPSALGNEGVDAVVDPEAVEDLRRALGGRLREVDAAAAEALRIHRGVPRWRVDLQPDGFPVAARVDDAVAEAKGCFLGQEAVARIRNLGRPPTMVRHFATSSSPSPGGELFLASGEPVGRVTSVAPTRGGSILLARVRHVAVDAELTLVDGTPVRNASSSARSVQID